MTEADVFNQVLKKIRFRDFFSARARLLDAPSDADGWLDADTDFAGRVRVNVLTGRWIDEKKKEQPFVTFVIRYHRLVDTDSKGALRIMCNAVGHPLDGVQPGIKKLSNLIQIDDASNTDAKVRVPLTITGEHYTVYDVPKKFKVYACERILTGRCDECREQEFVIPAGSDAIIEACGATRSKVENVCHHVCCRWGQRPRVLVTDKWSVREAVCSQFSERLVDRADPAVGDRDPESSTQRPMERQIYIVMDSSRVDLTQPRPYTATGYVVTDPRNSRRTLLVEDLEPMKEPWERFKTCQHLDQLMALKAIGWMGIVNDLINHRTRIFGYDELCEIVLLAYLSPLHLNFNSEIIRGWVTAAIVGDSGVGKSKTFETISDMVGVGDIFSCQTGRRTGLTFCLQKSKDGRYSVKAGMMPRNSRKIVCVEEAQDMALEDIKSMGIAIDKGVLAVNFSDSATYETKTRLIFNWNPSQGRTLATYEYGVMALRDLLPVPSVIRRIDVAAFIRRLDDLDVYNQEAAPVSQPSVSKEMLRALVFYAWNLTPERVEFSRRATETILKTAKSMSGKLGTPEDIPLVNPSDFRNTLARLSAAWAVLDCSTHDDFKTISVHPEHVSNVETMLTRLYTHPHCALDRYAAQCVRRSHTPCM